VTTLYTGNAGAAIARAPPSILLSVDADDLNSELLNRPLATLADVVAFLQFYTALLGISRPNNDTLVVNGLGDAGPALQTAGPSTATTYKLVHEMAGFDAIRRRRYVGLTAGTACIVDAVNALWNGTAWVRDTDQADAVLWRVGGGQTQFQVWKMGQSGWDGSIVLGREQGGAGTITLHDGAIVFTGTSIGGWGSSNPTTGTAAPNRLLAKNICKAWGSIQLGSPPKWLDGFNVQDAITAPNSTTLQVNFVSPMTFAAYAVATNIVRVTATDLRFVDVLNKTQTGFQLRMLDGTGAALPVATAGLTPQMDFIVFGQQST
jgi:hypothetical protein